ncbi:hypothetical protein EVAR_20318_1 [Eumeta japonica]|uniref:Uncharacterized protein n=1 Tax=Eumeta variegata TaxID=151549 RepID=A0A4C1VQQ7_EUMVA|nr:hypothetical protein EVAR_20318_1 [Eumeta japonica]
MGKVKYDPPNPPQYPYKISKRLNILSVPRRIIYELPLPLPKPVNISSEPCPDRIVDVAYPYNRQFLLVRKMYRDRFSAERMDCIFKMLERSNATCYSKYANCVLDLKKKEVRDAKVKKGISANERARRLAYLNEMARPRRDFKPERIKRGRRKPLEEFLPRLTELAVLPEFRTYKPLDQQPWYKDPIKVSPYALKYKISKRMIELATPKKIPTND